LTRRIHHNCHWWLSLEQGYRKRSGQGGGGAYHHNKAHHSDVLLEFAITSVIFFLVPLKSFHIDLRFVNTDQQLKKQKKQGQCCCDIKKKKDSVSKMCVSASKIAKN